MKDSSQRTAAIPIARYRVIATFWFALMMGLLLSCLLPAAAHDLQTIVRMEGRIVVLEASYEGEEEASFLAVSVEAPADEGIKADAFQKGRTDFRGRFAFVPDRPGQWKITIDDEIGHRATETFVVPAVAVSSDASETPVPAGTPLGEGGRSGSDKVIVGLSILFGTSGLLMAFLTRRRKSSSA